MVMRNGRYSQALLLPWRYYYFYSPLSKKEAILTQGLSNRVWSLTPSRWIAQGETKKRTDLALFRIDSQALDRTLFQVDGWGRVSYCGAIPARAIEYLRVTGDHSTWRKANGKQGSNGHKKGWKRLLG